MRPAAWDSSPGHSDGSISTTVSATVSVSPAAPPAPAENGYIKAAAR